MMFPKIGAAVKSILDDEVVMTVYDRNDSAQMAYCNWLVVHEMRTRVVPFDMLLPAVRT